jgi:AraC-like DNA-binding protein
LEVELSVAVTTRSRLERSVQPFELVENTRRKFQSPKDLQPSIATLGCNEWQESSSGDKMHKLILVVEGQVDVEGASGGWLVIANHLILIPAERTFNLRTSAKARLVVVHLDPNDHDWHHHGCWVTGANTLALEYLAHLQSVSTTSKNFETTRHLFRSLSILCRDWFANPRILWLPAAQSDEMRSFVTYVRNNLVKTSVAGACKSCNLAQRTLQRLSLQEFSFGLKTLITEVRMMHAMELLVRRDASVTEVASAVGFSSMGSFASAFNTRVGQSPSEFRLKNANSRKSCKVLLS